MKSLTERKVEAIELFTGIFSGRYMKLSPGDVDFKVFSEDGSLLAYVEVVDANRRIRDSNPVSVHVDRYARVCMKMLNPTIIWICDDGILYGKVKKMYGTISWSGVVKAPMLHFNPRQQHIKYIRRT